MPNGGVEWVYHVTPKQNALNIKKEGMMKSAAARGLKEPHHEGTFARNRREQEGTKIEQYIRSFIRKLIGYGSSIEAIENKFGNYSPFPFTPDGKGSNGNDHIRLDKEVNDKLVDYGVNVLGLPQDKMRQSLKSQDLRKTALGELKNKVEELTSTILREKKHFLYHLARQYAHFYYEIEAAVTLRHIYFFKASDAVAGYNGYRNHHQSSHDPLAILRVASDRVSHLIQDSSEGKGLMTDRPVDADLFEVMDNLKPGNHITLNELQDAENWKPLQDLT